MNFVPGTMEEEIKRKKYQKCAGCDIYLHKASGYIKTLDTEDDLSNFLQAFGKNVDMNVELCSKCYSKLRLVSHQKSKQDPSKQETPESSIDSQLASSSQSSSMDGSQVVYPEPKPQEPFQLKLACKSTLITEYIIPASNRCGRKHLIKNRFYQGELDNIKVHSSTSTITVTELSKLLEQLSVRVDAEIHDKVGDFTFPEERLIVLTGLTWENIIELRGMMTSLRDSVSRNVTQALVVLLFKLVSGNSNKIICAVLGLERDQQVSDFCNSILTSFEKDVLPTRFGIGVISREELINHNTPVAKALHDIKDNELALIADGTYLRHEKSSNNNYQRKSFSGQKKVPLCKPFTICTLDGYIVDSAGPFEANLNDAQIMECLMEDPNGLRKLMQKNDLWVVDRGFRDVKEKLETLGFKVLMPALKGKRNQLTAEESNHSRSVTAIRWPVELNKFGKRFITDPSLTDEIVSRMIEQRNLENTLASEVETGHWSRRKIPFQLITSDQLLDFPELTERDLKIFFTGTYQLQQSISYLAEMMGEDNKIELYYLKETNEILKVQVRSRHVSRKTYNSYIHYRPNSIGYQGIRGHYCECANGNRTIGCCAHIAAVIYYLSHGRYLSKIVKPAEILSSIFAVEKVSPVINDDSDED
ncbi:uncharacterized protein LOC131675522 [Phymastichus coffea]|uniref:uncharacterized protein LOC131675522 n=1 Tax=Phymastichus coffea TaxID=108790 RepID=UPI00273C4522|nr:uncharacterized protein LOC131675522 [Phymastichus coffea]